MTKENFINLINEYKKFIEYTNEYYKFGIDFYESKFPIIKPVEKILFISLESVYETLGIDWIDWFIYEDEFGAKELEAWDAEGKLICQTAGDLYDYIEQYKK